MHSILDMTREDLQSLLAEQGQPPYRATQIMQWVWQKGVMRWEEMTNLPANLREQMPQTLALRSGNVIQQRESNDGVVKLLLGWPDGEQTEAVGIPTPDRLTACISTQAGCAMGCAFCASGLEGLERNLTAGEILEQVFAVGEAMQRRVSNVVFMGTGEPLANYDATVAAVRALIDPQRGGLSARHITVSTCGLPDAIRRLAVEDMPITLAISLHAPNDALRKELMPAAAKYPIRDILAAAREFFQARGREITLEYVLLQGLNDMPDHANQFARLAGGLRCNVNLIRYNPVASLPYQPPSRRAVEAFAEALRQQGVNVTIRRSRGIDTDAACGQLRRRHD